MKRLYNEYQNIWHCKNPSHKLKEIKKIIKSYLRNMKAEYTFDKNGNMFIGNFEKSVPCLVAHLDSVHSEKPQNVKLIDNNILVSSSGIGGDDKCGIVAILEILKKNKDINAIFTIDEEVGGIGASKIEEEQIKNVCYFIEIDRQGKKDIINNIYGDKIASDEFIGDISHIIKEYNFELNQGAYTDVLEFSTISLISSINLSSGYYLPHTKKEYVNLEDLNNTINFVKAILNTTQKSYYIPEFVEYNNMAYSNDEIDLCYAIEDVKDLNTLIDLTQICDYDDMESMLLKAYEMGRLDREKELGLTNWENMAYLNQDKWS